MSQSVKNIYVVDDDAMLSTMLIDFLHTKGYNPQACGTGEECLGKLAGNQGLNIVVLDYYLNSVSKNAANGLQILEAIHELDPDAHVIMLSSQESYGIAARTIQKGAERYVLKGNPNAFQEIAEMIDEL
ncbi:MAG: response regulator [Chitinophagales bacterium]|nr:response regulator [Chitinophagales bacterium]